LDTLRKNTLFRIALLLILSLKVSVFVYDNYTSTEFSVEKVSLSDIEDSETEEKELDEQKKIVEYISTCKSSFISSIDNPYKTLLEKYNSRYLEYATPPPEHL
jgi:hypothetical protein